MIGKKEAQTIEKKRKKGREIEWRRGTETKRETGFFFVFLVMMALVFVFIMVVVVMMVLVLVFIMVVVVMMVLVLVFIMVVVVMMVLVVVDFFLYFIRLQKFSLS